jgi:glycosyltransferase involved in cell wall biosynthesis
MTCWLVPETHSRANVAVARHFAERVLCRADGLIAISESTRRDALRILNLRPEKVEVIYPGVSDAFFQTTPESAAAAAAKYGLERPYVLFVGTIEPRKNVDRLLDACGLALRQLLIVLAGLLGWVELSTVARLQLYPLLCAISATCLRKTASSRAGPLSRIPYEGSDRSGDGRRRARW